MRAFIARIFIPAPHQHALDLLPVSLLPVLLLLHAFDKLQTLLMIFPAEAILRALECVCFSSILPVDMCGILILCRQFGNAFEFQRFWRFRLPLQAFSYQTARRQILVLAVDNIPRPAVSAIAHRL